MSQVGQTVRRYVVINPALSGRPGGEIPAQKPSRSFSVKVPEHPEPDAAQMAVNLTKAMAVWVAQGLPVVTTAQYEERQAICAPCEYWKKQGNFGLGKCTAPGCGCTKFAAWQATKTCKYPGGSKWPALTPTI